MTRSIVFRRGLIWMACALGGRPGGDIASIAMDMRVPGCNTEIIYRCFP